MRMRGVLFSLMLMISFHCSMGQNLTIDVMRKEFSVANADSTTCANIYQKSLKDNGKDNTMNCYKGAISITMAGFVKGGQEKLKLFKSGRTLLESAISNDANNVELRFVRFTIQTSCPKLLGYNKEIKSDKEFILANYNHTSVPFLKSQMKEFLSHSAYLDDTEKQKLK